MAIPDEWKNRLEEFTQAFRHDVTLTAEDALVPVSPRARATIDILEKCGKRWSKEGLFATYGSLNRDCAADIYAFGLLDRKKLAALCKNGVLPSKPFMFSRFLSGDASAKEAYAEIYASELVNLAFFYPDLGYGADHKIDKERLLETAAVVGYAEESSWRKILQTQDMDVIHAFLDKNAALYTVYSEMTNAAAQGQMAYFDKMCAVMTTRRGFIRADDETLVTTKYLPEQGGFTSLRTVFNFSTRRVHEIHDRGYGKEASSTMQSCSFSDFDTDIIEQMREKLIALEGKPPALHLRIDKGAGPKAAL